MGPDWLLGLSLAETEEEKNLGYVLCKVGWVNVPDYPVYWHVNLISGVYTLRHSSEGNRIYNDYNGGSYSLEF